MVPDGLVVLDLAGVVVVEECPFALLSAEVVELPQAAKITEQANSGIATFDNKTDFFKLKFLRGDSSPIN